MAKWVCSVCGYVHEGDTAPEKCPQCGVPADKFNKQEDGMSWAAEHVVGVAQGVSEDILEDLRANFNGECSEVGMYLAMARVAHREGYPEIGLYWRKRLMKRLSMLQSLRNSWVRWLPTARRRILRCAWQLRTALPQASLILQNARRLRTLTQSMIPFMRWQETRLVTARHLQAC